MTEALLAIPASRALPKSCALLAFFFLEAVIAGLFLHRFASGLAGRGPHFRHRRGAVSRTGPDRVPATVDRPVPSVPVAALAGLCVLCAYAQTFSLFGGLARASNFYLLGLLTLQALSAPRRWRDDLTSACRTTNWRSLLLVVPVALILPLNALTNAFGADVALYHLSEFRWVAEYGTVPGLANLHGRFGFNSALAPLAGLLATGFGLPFGRQIANPLVVLVTAAFALETFRRPPGIPAGSRVYQWAATCGFLALAWSPGLSSPQADVASAAATLAAGCALARWLDRVGIEGDAPGVSSVLFTLLLAVQLKLSYAPFAAIGASLCLAVATRRNPRAWPGLVAAGTAFCLSYLARGYVLSGYPLYPLDVGGLPVDWAVPASAVRLEHRWVLSWARAPGIPWQKVLADQAWVPGWFAAALHNPIFWRPVALGCLGGGVVFAVAWCDPDRRRCPPWAAWSLLPPSVAVAAWFFTAPDPRFAEGAFWALAAAVLALAASVAAPDQRRTGLTARGVTFAFGLFIAISGLGRLNGTTLKCPNYVAPPAPCEGRTTRSGLVVCVPTATYAPGDAPLPNTVPDRFDPDLELRGSTLRDGFRTRNRRWAFGSD